jgi:uncharacterized membrane protein YbaN (DUF454 family)
MGSPEPSSGEPLPPVRPPPIALAMGWRRPLWLGVGLFFVGLGGLGVFVPVLPTTPFVLLASFCFLRSSPRHHAWLRRSRLFGRLLADWDRHHGVRRRTKVVAIALTLAGAGASLWRTGLSGPLAVVLLVLVGVGIAVIVRLPTIED